MFDMQRVGRNILELRKKSNMTQTELADNVNVSFQAVSNWERGNSMPDISKLPELAKIFGVSVDTLIGEKSKLVHCVINKEMEEYIESNEVSKEELEEHIPILKPEQVETIVGKMDFSKVDDMNAFLPYLDSETVTLLAQKKVDKGESIKSFLPFLEDAQITKFAQIKIDKGESINIFLPYELSKFAQQTLEKGESIELFLPFLKNEDITLLAEKKIDKGESIRSFLPFIDSEVLKNIALRVVK